MAILEEILPPREEFKGGSEGLGILGCKFPTERVPKDFLSVEALRRPCSFSDIELVVVVVKGDCGMSIGSLLG